MQTIVNSFLTAVNMVVTFIPRLVGALVIGIVGWLIAWGVSKVLTSLLRKVGIDRAANRIGLSRLEQRMGVRMDTAGILGAVAFWFLFLIFLVPAADALGLPAVSNVLNTLVAYIPNVFVAVLVLFLGSLFGTFVGDIVRGLTSASNVGNARVLGGIARWAIIGFSALIALEQLQIAPALMNILFTGVVAALALAFALAFGLGGQEAARRWLARSENAVTNVASNADMDQVMSSVKTSTPSEQMQVEQMRARQMQADQMRAEQMGTYQRQYEATPTAQPAPVAPPAQPAQSQAAPNPNTPYQAQTYEPQTYQQQSYSDQPTERYQRPNQP